MSDYFYDFSIRLYCTPCTSTSYACLLKKRRRFPVNQLEVKEEKEEKKEKGPVTGKGKEKGEEEEEEEQQLQG